MSWPNGNPDALAGYQRFDQPAQEESRQEPLLAAEEQPSKQPYEVHIGRTVTPDMVAPPGVIPDDLLHYLCKIIVPVEDYLVVEDRLANTSQLTAVIDIDKLGKAIRAKAKNPSPRSEAGAWIQGLAAGMRSSSFMQTTVDFKIDHGSVLKPRAITDSSSDEKH